MGMLPMSWHRAKGPVLGLLFCSHYLEIFFNPHLRIYSLIQDRGRDRETSM